MSAARHKRTGRCSTSCATTARPSCGTDVRPRWRIELRPLNVQPYLRFARSKLRPFRMRSHTSRSGTGASAPARETCSLSPSCLRTPSIPPHGH
eukprot:1903980-Prymnesium_polylepis.2